MTAGVVVIQAVVKPAVEPVEDGVSTIGFDR